MSALTVSESQQSARVRQAREQLPGEPDPSFRRFEILKRLGPERTLTRYYEVWLEKRRDTDTKVTLSAFHALSCRWQWVERAHAWDVSTVSLTVERIGVLSLVLYGRVIQRTLAKLETGACDPESTSDLIAVLKELSSKLPPGELIRHLMYECTEPPADPPAIDAEVCPPLLAPDFADGAGI